MSNNYGKHKVGELLECIHSASVGYTVGKHYEVVEETLGQSKTKGLIADDGFFDSFGLIISAFKPVDSTTQAIKKLKVVK